MTDLDIARADAVDVAAHHLAVAAAELAPWFPGLLTDVEIIRARVHALRPPARVTPSAYRPTRRRLVTTRRRL